MKEIVTHTCTVFPEVNLSLSPEVVRAGGSVNVTCRAESYPPAKSDDYQLKHPQNKNISHTPLEVGSGVVHQILAASIMEDTGVYECIVTLTLSDYNQQKIQSNVHEANLAVYGRLHSTFDFKRNTCKCTDSPTITEIDKL